MGTLANNEDPDKIQYNAAFYQGLHCLPRSKRPLGAEKHQNFGTCDQVKCKMDSPILLISICTGKSVRIKTRASPAGQYTPICQDRGGITSRLRKEDHSFLCPTHHPD